MRFAVVFAVLITPRLFAQHVGGIVRDSVLGDPVPGAVVSLLDSTGATTARTITGGTGRYAITPLRPGVYRLRVVRIGYRPRTARLDLRAASDTTVDLLLSRLPTLLEPVEVDDKSLCDRNADRSLALSLWEQARAALLATAVGREANPATVIAITYDRTLDRDGRRILRQTVHHDSMLTSEPFLAARAASELATTGYVETEGNIRSFFAPDVEGLLDPAFAGTHCFSLRRDTDEHPGELGLGFEPTPNRSRIPEIAGTLWIDSTARELRRLEFRYVHVDREEERADAGGVLHFRSAPNGVTLIDQWNLHIPYVSRSFVRVAQASLARLYAVHDMGAQLAEARWPDGTHWTSPLGVVRGTLRRVDGSPVANGLIWFDGSDDSSHTAADGSFAITRILPGPYEVHAADSLAGLLRFSQNPAHRVVIDSVAPLADRITIPELRRAIADSCRGHFPGPGRTLLLGRLSLSDGSPASRAQIEGTWLLPSALVVGWQWRTITDTTGLFRLCGVDNVMPLRLMVSTASGATTAAATVWVRTEPLSAIHLAIPSAPAADKPRHPPR